MIFQSRLYNTVQMMLAMDLIHFACDAVEAVYSIVIDLSKSESPGSLEKQFYDTFAASLWAVFEHLKSPQSADIGDTELVKLLDDLEKISNVRSF